MRPSTVPRTPLPVTASKSSALSGDSRARFAPATIASASGCSEPVSNAAARRSTVFLRADGHDIGQPRLAFGQRAGLVDDHGIDAGHPLQRLGILDQHARLRAAPAAVVIEIGVASPRAQGQAMISTDTAAAMA